MSKLTPEMKAAVLGCRTPEAMVWLCQEWMDADKIDRQDNEEFLYPHFRWLERVYEMKPIHQMVAHAVKQTTTAEEICALARAYDEAGLMGDEKTREMLWEAHYARTRSPETTKHRVGTMDELLALAGLTREEFDRYDKETEEDERLKHSC